ncbi:MAG: preprotein translocase subunit YajC [Bacteroidales bacterium]
MNTFLVILQAQEQAAGAAKGGNWSFIIMMVAVFVVMYFLMIRPQKKRQKELQAYRNNLQKGDKVVTAGGIYGTIVEVKEAYVLLEIDTNVKIRVDKTSLVKDTSDLQQK